MIGRSKKSVQTTLQFVFFLLVTLVFLVYISYFIISESHKIKTQAFESVTRDTQTASAFMDEEIKSVNTVMQNVAYSNLVKEHFLTYLNKPASSGDGNYSEMQNIKVLTDLLTAIMGPSHPVDQIYLYSLEGGCVGVGLDNSNTADHVSDKPWYAELQSSEDNRLIFCDRDERLAKFFTYEDGSRFLTVASVYLSTYYKPQGVIEVKHSISSLISKLKKIDTGVYHEKIYIYDQTGKSIYSFTDDNMAELYAASVTGSGQTVYDESRHISYDKNTHLFVNTSSYSGFTTVIAIDNSDLYRPIYDYIKANLLIFAGFLVLILLLSYVVSRIITIPVMKMYSGISSLHTDEESMLTGSLEKIDTNIIELDTLYSAVMDMHDRAKASMNREIVLNNQRLQSQILALQSQMNPHFLYNSLATISAMADEGMNDEVTKMCQTISRILRYISSDKDPLVPVSEDVSHAKDYLECMKMRYEDDLIYHINIPEEMKDIRIPKLCLQLIVENSIKYATKNVRAPWIISIDGRMTGIYWEITVKDNGPGFLEDDLKEINDKIAYINQTDLLPGLEINGMGLMNIYIRFKTLYHGKHIFRVSNYAEGGALVTIGGELDLDADAQETAGTEG
ncbi:MAG: histidine kinase [Lachnospiraceae bacterium]|nr:histidine kinase [Lachnospiraceae bacterium]